MEYRKGLKNVIAGRTRKCKLDEQHNKLLYCGVDLENLAGKVPFEEVACLLLYGKENFVSELSNFKSRVRRTFFDFGANEVWEKVAISLVASSPNAHSMELLRQAINTFATYDFRREAQTKELDREISVDLIGNMGYFVALVHRYLAKEKPLLLLPLDLGSMSANLFYLLGKNPTNRELEMMDLLFTLYAEHEFNASTWGGVRIAATVGTDVYSGIINGIGNLKGILHGGANETTWNFIREMRQVGDIENCLLEKVGMVLNKNLQWKMPGFGHAVYKKGDVRVPILKKFFEELSREKKDMSYFDLCWKIEQTMLKAHRLYPLTKYPSFRWWFPNVDFWAAPVYKLMGIPSYLNTPLFAVSRIAGWCAHWLEAKYEFKEKLVRPRAEYVEN